MVAPGQRFTPRRILTLKFLSGYVHRGTLPQSRPIGRASSLREGAGNGCVPFNRVLAKIRGWRAIFIAPTQLKSFYILPFIGGHSLSHARWA